MKYERKLKINSDEGTVDVVQEETEVTVVTNDDSSWTTSYEGQGEMTSEEGVQKRIDWFNIGKWALIILAGALPVFFLPFTVLPIEINKTLLAVTLLSIALISWLVTTIERRSLQIPYSLSTLAVLSIVILTTASSFLSKSHLSFLGNLSQVDSLLSIGLYALTFWLSSYFISRQDLPRILVSLGIGVGLSTLFGLMQIFEIFTLPWNFAHQASFNTVGSIFGLGILMALGVLLAATISQIWGHKNEKIAKQSLVVIVAFLIGLAIINYQLLWFAVGAVALILAGRQFSDNKKLGLLLGIVIASIFFALVSQYLPRFGNPPLEIRPSVATSYSVIKEIVRTRQAFLGFGPATFGYAMRLYQPTPINQAGLLGVAFPQGYNYFLTVIAGVGIVGFAGWLFLMISFLYLFHKRIDDPVLSTIGFSLLFLFICLFLFPAFFAQMVLLFFALGILTSFSGGVRNFDFVEIPRWRMFSIFVFGVGIIAFILAGVYFFGQRYAAAAYYEVAVSSFQAGQSDRGFASMDKVVRLDATSDSYWRLGSQALLLQARQLLSQGNSAADNQNLQTNLRSIVARARDAAVTAVNLNPADSANWDNLGNIYENIIPIATGADELAVESYRKAIALDPKNPQEPLNIARALLTSAVVIENAQGQGEASRSRVTVALAALEQSLAISPNYAPANFSIVQLYIKQGEIAKAAQKIQDIQSLSPLDAGLAYQLGLIAYQSKQLDIAQDQFQRALSLYPDYSNALYYLGLIYDSKGLKSQAKPLFERLLQLNPDNEEIKKLAATYSNLPAPAATSTTSTPLKTKNP